MSTPTAHSLGYEVELPMAFDPAIEHVTAELKKEGFGILSRIDVHLAFKEKLGKDFRRYAILGACNPPLAFQALTSRPETGLLLPCNVTVEETGPDACQVRIIKAGEMMKMARLDRDATIAKVGAEADARLTRVAQALRG